MRYDVAFLAVALGRDPDDLTRPVADRRMEELNPVGIAVQGRIAAPEFEIGRIRLQRDDARGVERLAEPEAVVAPEATQFDHARSAAGRVQPLDDSAEYELLLRLVVATEDADFWEHSGISGRGFLRSGWNFVSSFGRRREGGSTLTMQLIRTVTAKRQKRLDRKLKEIILARKLEKAYSKKQIMEMYANEVYFGGGRYGIEAAA